MSQIDQLVEHHIRESELQLRHVDTLMAQARAARTANHVPEAHAGSLSRIEQEHARLADALHALRNDARPASADAAERGKGLTGLLQAVGLELEKTLIAIGDRSGR